MQVCRALSLSLALTLSSGFLFVSRSFAQIQSTITCQSGEWDVLSLMMMDPTLAANYHMEGDYGSDGAPGAHMYTNWSQNDSKVWYIKHPQGNPWDINLYDSTYVYQWVTEVDKWPTPTSHNYWGDPTSCKKFNNGFNSADGHNSDESFRWAARCAIPGGVKSSYWNSVRTQTPPPDYNTNYYVYLDQALQKARYGLGDALVELKVFGTIAIYWGGSGSTTSWTANTVSVQYTYSCSAQDVNTCKDREVFDYAYDNANNPHDLLKHSYGWVHWAHYTNSTNPANWGTAPVAETTFNHVVPGQTTPNFQCF